MTQWAPATSPQKTSPGFWSMHLAAQVGARVWWTTVPSPREGPRCVGLSLHGLQAWIYIFFKAAQETFGQSSFLLLPLFPVSPSVCS